MSNLGRARRVLIGLGTAVAAAGIGGCALTPREEFLQARAIRFNAAPGGPSAAGGVAARPGGAPSLAAGAALAR